SSGSPSSECSCLPVPCACARVDSWYPTGHGSPLAPQPMTGIRKLKAFARSPHHAWLGLLALGGGLATLTGIGAIVGAAAYALGWIYLPDSGIFNRWLANRQQADDGEKLRTFLLRRRQLYDALRPGSRRR